MALVHVDKEVVLFLVSSHVDETDSANVTPIGIESVSSSFDCNVVKIIVGVFPLFVFFTFLCTWPYCAPFSYEGHAFVFLNKSGGTWDRRSLL